MTFNVLFADATPQPSLAEPAWPGSPHAGSGELLGPSLASLGLTLFSAPMPAQNPRSDCWNI